jgi:hypothetical protein
MGGNFSTRVGFFAFPEFMGVLSWKFPGIQFQFSLLCDPFKRNISIDLEA